ncbi:hypothetical protein BD413DRAFT_96774 [Trametes elegans]|nr:hypothetical protein BD413DRAFT_96774 [Trametes elegans]
MCRYNTAIRHLAECWRETWTTAGLTSCECAGLHLATARHGQLKVHRVRAWLPGGLGLGKQAPETWIAHLYDACPDFGGVAVSATVTLLHSWINYASG